MRMENSRGDGVQHMFGAFKLEGMSGVGSSLKTSDDVVVWSQYIDKFTLAFISPL